MPNSEAAGSPHDDDDSDDNNCFGDCVFMVIMV